MNSQEKILPISALADWRQHVRAAGKRLVVTNGCFDLLHRGHVSYLETARNQGDLLLVGVNGDQAVRTLKGPKRPINPEEDRAAVLAALQAVDAVVVFPEPEATHFLSLAQPDLYVKGGDYTLDTLNPTERATIERAGGKIVIIPFVPGKSTTRIVEALSSSSA